MLLSGIVSLSISGFAVDNADRLYVGTQRNICIYQNGKIINTVKIPTSRSYVFTIDGNDILLATPHSVFRMTLDGIIKEETEDPSANVYNRLQRKREFVSEKGDIYKKSGLLLQPRIIKNGNEIVYQLSTLSVVVKLLLAICFISLFGFPVYLCKRTRNKD